MSRLSGFLQGVRILDLSRHLPGPMATLFLGDMGAEILKIEPPAGDEMRVMGPLGADGRSVYFDAVNAGKVTRRLDFTRADDRAGIPGPRRRPRTSLHRIISAGCDVAARSRVRDAQRVESAPHLLLVERLRSRRPSGARAAHDVNYLSLVGTLFHNDGGDTPFFDPPVADCAGALFAALTIVGALHRRTRDGEGMPHQSRVGRRGDAAADLSPRGIRAPVSRRGRPRAC